MDEKLKEKLLEELRKEYSVTLKPLKEKQFSVGDILEKYHEKICSKIKVENDWQHNAAIDNCIRKVMCLGYGVWNTKDLPLDKRTQFREDLEIFIKQFILKGE